MVLLISWFFIVLFSFYIYLKILKLTANGRQIGCGILFSAAMSVVIYALSDSMPLLRFVMITLFAGIFAGLMTRTRLDLAIASFSLANGISYGFWLMSNAVVYGIIWLLPIPETDILTMSLASLPQFGLVYGLFSIRRMRNGMPFLREKGAGVVGLVISSIILASILLLPNQDISHEVRLVLIISAVVAVVGIIVWWRRGLTNLYKKRMQQRYIKELEKTPHRLVFC